jgi:hypothetical protein
MIVKAGTYYRVGASTGFSSKSSLRVFGSQGRSAWTDELARRSYFWPVILAICLIGLFSVNAASLGYWLVVAFDLAWLLAVSGDHEAYKKEWACSKCGAVWNPEQRIAG